MDREQMAAVIALSLLKGTDAEFLGTLRLRHISPADFLDMTPQHRGEATGMSFMPSWSGEEVRSAMLAGKREADFCISHNIRVLSPAIDGYPRRLDILADAPKTLYVLGDTDLDAFRMISIVGTRRITAAGAKFCTSFIRELGELVVRPVIVSGLAYGTDVTAHNAALDNSLPTVAVLAHGLDMIYPASHRDVARRIVRDGGALVTEYPAGTKPFRGNFLKRNHIIAALSDGVMVVESAIKGGAMSTAHAALDYGRTVMALPGRASDSMSEGCNHLIRTQCAILTTSARQACDSLDWPCSTSGDNAAATPSLFREPAAELLPVYRLLQQSENPMGIDTLTALSGLPPARLAPILFMLEEDEFIARLPNNRYTVV